MRTAQEKAISTTIANSVLQAYGMQSMSATGQEGQKHTSRLGLLLAITPVIVWMPESRSRLACQLIDDGRTAISDRTAGQMLIYDYTACLSPLVVGLGTPIAALTRVLIRRPYRRSVVWILVVMTWVVLILSPLSTRIWRPDLYARTGVMVVFQLQPHEIATRLSLPTTTMPSAQLQNDTLVVRFLVAA